MTKKKLMELLKSGNFTLAYHDKGYCCLYEGKLPYTKLSEAFIKEFEGCDEGYIPVEVQLLIEALGGRVLTI